MQWKTAFIEEHGEWETSKKLFTMAVVLKGINDFYVGQYEQRALDAKDQETK